MSTRPPGVGLRGLRAFYAVALMVTVIPNGAVLDQVSSVALLFFAALAVTSALMAVKLLSDDKGIRFDKTVSTHHLTSLAIDFLNGGIKSHADIADWFADKPVYKTHLGDKLFLDS